MLKIDSTGKFASIFSFDGTDGAEPYAPLIQGTDGAFYGTTTGGDLNDGAVFRITPDGALTTLHAFCAEPLCLDGSYAYGGLLEGTNGTFYGLTVGGGDDQDGTIYSLNTGLGPFVSLVRNSGVVGSVNGILGQGFKGTTSVAFNGTPASFSVVADTAIETTAPEGATSGYVTVTTPSGTLTSNVQFYVRA